jgi:hypothetical protein
MITFSHNDAWILYAIPPGIEACPLPEIIARADYVNHAIPTKDEIASALTKGLRSGLLQRSLSGIRYAPMHQETIKKVTEKPRYARDAWDALHRHLCEGSWEEMNAEVFLLDDADVDVAYKEYLNLLKKRK